MNKPDSTSHKERIVGLVFPAGSYFGKEVVSLALAKGLRDAGWDTRIMTSRWNNGEFIRHLDQAAFRYDLLWFGYFAASLQPHMLKMSWGQLQKLPALIRGYRRLIARSSPCATIHTNWHHVLLLTPFIDPARDIFWLHDILPDKPIHRFVFRTIFRRFRYIVCVSQAVKRRAQAIGVPEARLRVIYNGIEHVAPPVKRNADKSFRLGIVGQVGPWKGHDDVVEALGLLSRRGMRVALSIIGAGPRDYVDKLKQRVVELGIDRRVEWSGFVADQREIYENIDVCVQPSRFEEPFGMSALEASAFGLPVVCTARGGLPEVVQHGETGLVVEAENPAQLADAIARLANDPERCKTMGEAARNRATTVFSLANMVNQFTDLLAEHNNAVPHRFGDATESVRG